MLVLSAALIAVLVIKFMANGQVLSAMRGVKSWALAGIVVLTLLAAAFQSYGVAYMKTGNPVFPLYNEVFKSPHFASSNFSDSRWIHGFGFSSFFGVFWEQKRFFESMSNFVAGFQYLLVPLGTVALAMNFKTHRRTLAVAFVLWLFAVAMLSQTQYWRYIFPVFALACIVVVRSAASLPGAAKLASFGVLLAAAVANFYHLPGISWALSAGLSQQWRLGAKSEWLTHVAPAAILTEEINRRSAGHKQPTVLYPNSSPSGATLQGKAAYLNWYSPSRERAYLQLKTADDLVMFLVNHQISHVIVNQHESIQAGSPDDLLMRRLATFSNPINAIGAFALYELTNQPTRYEFALDIAPNTSIPSPLGSGAPPVSRIVAGNQPPSLVRIIDVKGLTVAQYALKVRCAKPGVFNAQINWDIGRPFYRLVTCNSGIAELIDVVRIPPGATRGEVYVSARDDALIELDSLRVGVR
jgi:hypothetical protein